jgi:hypothetical protein
MPVEAKRTENVRWWLSVLFQVLAAVILVEAAIKTASAAHGARFWVNGSTRSSWAPFCISGSADFWGSSYLHLAGGWYGERMSTKRALIHGGGRPAPACVRDKFSAVCLQNLARQAWTITAGYFDGPPLIPEG